MTTTNPVNTAGVLTWSGSFPVAANSTASLSFTATVSSTPGSYTNSATADAGAVAVVGTGATASVTVTAAGNHPPVAVTDTLTTAEDTAGPVSVLTNDTDADSDTLTVTGKTNGAHGTVSCTVGGVCTYTPAANYNGPDSFTYTVSDGHGGTATGTVTVTVTPVNDPPVAVDDTLTTSLRHRGTRVGTRR